MKERWSYALLLVLLLGHLFLLSTHQRSRGNRVERLMLATLGPVGGAVSRASDAVGEALQSLRLAGTLRRENLELRRELVRLRHELVRLQGVEEKLARLSRTTGYTRPETGDAIVADVVYVDQASSLRTLVLYTGTIEPRRNQPVVTDRGLVGRIVVPAGRYAKVLLLTDPSLAVSAMIERTRQRGVVRGRGDALTLNYIPLKADIHLGDRVVTAGIDGIFPRGVPIGRVSEVAPGQGLFLRISVQPSIDFSALDQVYVLTQEAVPPEVREAVPAEGRDDAGR